jgi:hypothetical protein
MDTSKEKAIGRSLGIMEAVAKHSLEAGFNVLGLDPDAAGCAVTSRRTQRQFTRAVASAVRR